MDCQLAAELARLANMVVVLLMLCAFFIAGFTIADSLGFIAPIGNEKPKEKWLWRQEKIRAKRQREWLIEHGMIPIDNQQHLGWKAIVIMALVTFICGCITFASSFISAVILLR